MELLQNERDFAIIKYSRGCPNRCSYCAVPKLEGCEMRFMDNEKFIEEIEEKICKFGIRRFSFWESNLLVDAKNRFEKVLDKIIEKKLNIAFTFPEGLQPNLVYPDLAEKMVKAGAKSVVLPLESSNESMYKSRFHRSVTLDQWRNSIEMFKKAG
jgi:radical SAM superfamily enzyme YgiQ (UPF0313 family)